MTREGKVQKREDQTQNDLDDVRKINQELLRSKDAEILALQDAHTAVIEDKDNEIAALRAELAALTSKKDKEVTVFRDQITTVMAAKDIEIAKLRAEAESLTTRHKTQLEGLARNQANSEKVPALSEQLASQSEQHREELAALTKQLDAQTNFLAIADAKVSAMEEEWQQTYGAIQDSNSSWVSVGRKFGKTITTCDATVSVLMQADPEMTLKPGMNALSTDLEMRRARFEIESISGHYSDFFKVVAKEVKRVLPEFETWAEIFGRSTSMPSPLPGFLPGASPQATAPSTATTPSATGARARQLKATTTGPRSTQLGSSSRNDSKAASARPAFSATVPSARKGSPTLGWKAATPQTSSVPPAVNLKKSRYSKEEGSNASPATTGGSIGAPAVSSSTPPALPSTPSITARLGMASAATTPQSHMATTAAGADRLSSHKRNGSNSSAAARPGPAPARASPGAPAESGQTNLKASKWAS
ncbi:hypothetical protein EJ07DRAFT_159532 [Lizonia empirigonia]|nr:hypothetical protein EJ07DRAFT_159532 [Lizonia empirigonia]